MATITLNIAELGSFLKAMEKRQSRPVGGPRAVGLTAAQRNRVLSLLGEDDLTLTLPFDITPDERKNDLQPWSEKARVLSDTLEDLRNGGDGTAVDRFTDEQWNEIFQRSQLTDAEENALVDRYLLEQAGTGLFHMLLLQLAPPVPPLPPAFDDAGTDK